MKNKPNTPRPHPCCACGRIIPILYPELKRLREDHEAIMRFILEKEEAETRYLTAEETWNHVGISESTLLRCQRRGEITVAKMKKGKKYFRDRDVERLRRAYWGREL
ncbi:hypothetical protein [Parapedobacter sp. DT-150]|uniref:hypothetical protein n=1 Tax=Parapedobacter sp. DT-150 TaxID=3396162 RepID=UPI003F1DF6DE